VLANLNKVPPAVAADIRAKAATNGGQPVVQQDAQGKWHAVGVKGTY
jgi:hypothetical protein